MALGTLQSETSHPRVANEGVAIHTAESALGRRWSRDDSIRVLRRANQGIEIEMVDGFVVPTNRTAAEYHEALQHEIREEVANLRSAGDLVQSWSKDNEGLWVRDVLIRIHGLILDEGDRDPRFFFPSLVDLTLFSDEDYDLCEETSSGGEAEEVDRICTVCLEELYQQGTIAKSGFREGYEEHGTIVTLGCGHEYHGYCIGEWLRRGKNVCPLCRAKALPDEDDKH